MTGQEYHYQCSNVARTNLSSNSDIANPLAPWIGLTSWAYSGLGHEEPIASRQLRKRVFPVDLSGVRVIPLSFLTRY